jgi:UDP-glucose 4-epimerase
MKYLVSGGAGFIGSHIVDELLRLGNEVVVIDNFLTGKEENLVQHNTNIKLKVIRKSICDDLTEIFRHEKFDVVVHLAAMPRVQLSIAKPGETHEANINGTFNLLMFCKQFNVKRFVFSSSSSVYGDQEKFPTTEDMQPNPLSPYAMHKLVGELYCKQFNRLFEVETVALRYFNVYGPRQDPNGGYAGLIPKFFSCFLKGEAPTIFGDGEQRRDFTYVEDVVNANILAATTKDKKCFGEAFNIGGGKNYSVNEVSQIIEKLCDSKVKVIYGPGVVEARISLSDTSKAKEMLGWKQKFNFEEGMKITFEYFKDINKGKTGK